MIVDPAEKNGGGNNQGKAIGYGIKVLVDPVGENGYGVDQDKAIEYVYPRGIRSSANLL
jgi:hypothetical protein